MAEQRLVRDMNRLHETVRPQLQERNYTRALQALAELRDPVDAFFDQVMVLIEDDSLRHNRLAILNRISGLFLSIADISRLQD